MDTASTNLHDRLAALEQENAKLRSHLEACGRSYAVSQAEVARYRHLKQNEQERVRQAEPDEVVSTCSSSLEHHLLETTAEVARVLLTLTPLNAAVNTALEMIGEALETDRVNIVETVASSSNSVFPGWRVPEHEWNSVGTVPQYADQEAAQGSYEEIPEIFEQMHQGRTLGYLIEEMPEPFRNAQIAIGVRSTHLVPIFVEGQWWGVLGINDCRDAKQCGAAALSVLKIAADCIGSAIERDRAQQALLQAEQERAYSATKHSQELEQLNAELRQLLERLTESEERYRTLFELSSEGIYRWELDQPISVALPIDEQVEQIRRSLYVAEANAAYAAMYGLPIEAASGLRLSDAHISTSNKDLEFLRRWIENGYCIRAAESEEITPKGKRCYFFNNVIGTVEDGHIVGGWGTQLDISELRETQQALLETEQKRSQELKRINAELQQALNHLSESEERAWLTQVDITELRETQQALLQAEQARVAELAKANEALARTSQRLAEQPDLSAFLSHVALEAIAQLDADAAMLSMLDEQHQVLRAVAHVEQGQVASGLGAEMPINEAEFVNLLLETRKPRYFDLEREAHLFWPGAIAYHQQRHHQAVIAVPLFAGAEFLGHLGLAFTHTNPINEQSSELLYALAQQAALAIQLTRLTEEAKQAAIAREQEKAAQERAAELAKANEALKRTVSKLSEQPELDAFLNHVLTEAAGQIGACSNALFLYNAATHTLSMHAICLHGQIADILTDSRLEPYREPIPADISPAWRQICRTGWVVAHETDGTDPNSHPQSPSFHRAMGHETVVAVPLVVGGRTIGFMAPCFREWVEPNPEKIELVQSLAHQATLALELTRLAEEAKRAAIAREQEQAAQERAAELAKANEALRRSARNIAQNSSIEDILPSFLREAIAVSGASAGAVLRRVGVSEFEFVAILQGNDLICDERLKQHPFYSAVKQVSREDSTGWFTRLAAGETLWRLVDDDQAGPLPESGEYHHPHQQKSLWDIPYKIGDRVAGYLGLAFQSNKEPSQIMAETVTALATQVGLVLELTELAEEAKQAAIAREQQKAAQDRATELAKTNDALKHSLDRLAQESNLNSFLGHVLTEMANQVQATVGHIFLLNTETNTLKLCLEIQDGQLYSQARPDEPLLFHSAFPMDITPVFQFLCQKRTLASLTAGEFDGMEWNGVLEWIEREGFTEAVGLALIVGEQPVGLLGLAFHHQSSLKPEEAELIQALAHQATLAIQMCYLAEQAKQTAVLEERNRMAREIHDTIAQGLAGILIQLQAAEDTDLINESDRQAHIAQARHLAEVSLAEARRSVRALRPQVLEETNLAGALTSLMRNLTSNTSLKVTCRVQGTPRSLSTEVETNLLRIAQEAINNTLKHAEATHIQIELSYQPDHVQLRIQDDGQGFDYDQLINLETSKKGYGLISMQERSQQIGGNLIINSQFGEGTALTIVVPLTL